MAVTDRHQELIFLQKERDRSNGSGSFARRLAYQYHAREVSRVEAVVWRLRGIGWTI